MDEILRLSEKTNSGVPQILGYGNPKNEVILAPLCTILASKYDEIDSNIPQITTLLRIYNRCLRFSRQNSTLSNRPSSAFADRGTPTNGGPLSWSQVGMTLSFDDMVRAEKEVCCLLGWNLMSVTPYQILQCMHAVGIMFKHE